MFHIKTPNPTETQWDLAFLVDLSALHVFNNNDSVNSISLYNFELFTLM